MWEDNNINNFRENSKEITLNFIKNARKKYKYQSIGAFKDNKLIGSVSLNKFYVLAANVYLNNDYQCLE